MLVLFETPAGYAVFKVTDKGALSSAPEQIYKHFETAEKAQQILKLKAFSKFVDTRAALEAATAVCDGALDANLQSFLTELVKREKDGKMKIAVSDLKLGSLIKEKVAGVKPLFDASVGELMRGIRSQLHALLPGLTVDETRTMQLGLAHSLCRYKLKFSPDKVDVMIIQAIALLDELDKELNTYAMRVREWYGWHFPEMGKIVVDNLQYARCVQAMKIRTNAPNTDFSNVLTEDIEQALKEASQVSMGTEVAEEDVANILHLCDQVLKLAEYRASLYEYLRNRMSAIAPNLTVMVGELVGARLIAHAGSLLSLAKAPASTVQILGAEKALFRALKTKHDTPKYGLIYHASLVGQAAPKLKGKISRMLAAKTALACRADALGDETTPSIAVDNKAKVELRLRQLESGKSGAISKQQGQATPKKPVTQQQKYTPKNDAKTYNAEGDAAVNITAKASSSSSSSSSAMSEDEEDKAARKAAKKEAKRQKKEADAAAAVDTTTSTPAADGAVKQKKEKRKRQEEDEETPSQPAASSEDGAKKEKKKKKKSAEE